MKTPVIPGHEFYGVVAALGEGAAEKHGIKIGDRVNRQTKSTLVVNVDFVELVNIGCVMFTIFMVSKKMWLTELGQNI